MIRCWCRSPGGIGSRTWPESCAALLPDPADLAAFGTAARRLLGDRDQAARLGQAAHAHVREHYVGDANLLRYAGLLGTLIGDG
jgi:hypothetical protein